MGFLGIEVLWELVAHIMGCEEGGILGLRFMESSRNGGCLSQGFYSCTNIMTKKQVGKERVYSAYTSILLFITKGSQDWNSDRSESRS